MTDKFNLKSFLKVNYEKLTVTINYILKIKLKLIFFKYAILDENKYIYGKF